MVSPKAPSIHEDVKKTDLVSFVLACVLTFLGSVSISIVENVSDKVRLSLAKANHVFLAIVLNSPGIRYATRNGVNQFSLESSNGGAMRCHVMARQWRPLVDRSTNKLYAGQALQFLTYNATTRCGSGVRVSRVVNIPASSPEGPGRLNPHL